MPTLEDVARHAGVSTATVSKVLSNTPYFTAATREKVMRAVNELGYVPNLAARALSSGKTGIIGAVFPYVYEAFFTDPLILRLLHGIETQCNARGYNLLLSAPRVDGARLPDNYTQLIHSGYLDGVIAMGHPVDTVLAPALARDVPAVGIGYGAMPYYVRSDDHQGGSDLMRHVLGLGHRAIGLISVPEAMHASVTHRLIGLRAAADEAGLDLDSLPRVMGDWSNASGEAGVRALLEAHPDLTAIICLNDRMALGAIRGAYDLERSVPDDLTVVGYDDIPVASLLVPPLTTVNQRAVELGQHAAEMLFALLDRQDPPPVELPAQLMVRASSAAAPVRGVA